MYPRVYPGYGYSNDAALRFAVLRYWGRLKAVRKDGENKTALPVVRVRHIYVNFSPSSDQKTKTVLCIHCGMEIKNEAYFQKHHWNGRAVDKCSKKPKSK